jgi:hypothetical protein
MRYRGRVRRVLANGTVIVAPDFVGRFNVARWSCPSRPSETVRASSAVGVGNGGRVSKFNMFAYQQLIRLFQLSFDRQRCKIGT